MKSQIIKLVPVLSIAALLTACGTVDNHKNTGAIYMPDMTYSNAYETYSASEVKTPEGVNMSARKPVSGTIPRGYIPQDEKIRTNEAFLLSYMAKNHFTHDAAKWQEEYDMSGAKIQNPLEGTEANLAEGKRIYDINCAVCHGEKGDGNGQIVELPDGSDGPYTARPPKYGDRLPQIKDGNVFYSVSYGKGMMGGYGFQLSVKERWQVIHYINKLAGKTAGSATAATPETTAAAVAAAPKP